MTWGGLRAPAAAAVLAALVVVAGCGGGQERSFTLHAGFLGSSTGAQQSIGHAGRKAVDLALREIHRSIREAHASETITLKYRDDKSTYTDTVDAARSLVDAGTTCVVGPYGSGAAIGVSNSVFVPKKVLAISPGAVLDSLATLDNAHLLGRVSLPIGTQAPALAALMDEELGGAKGKTVNIAAVNTYFGDPPHPKPGEPQGLTRLFSKEWTRRGGRVGATVSYPFDQPTFDSQARTLTTNNPDAWVFFDTPEGYGKLSGDLVRTKKWDSAKSFTAEGLATQTIATNILSTNGLRGVAVGAPSQGKAAEGFARLYEKAPGPRRQTFDAQSFDALMLCYLSAVAAGSPSGPEMGEKLQEVASPPGRKYTWQQLPEAIKALEAGQDIDYEGASGPVDMDARGTPTAGVLDAFKFEQGRLLVYGQVAVPLPTGRKPALRVLTPAEIAKQIGAGGLRRRTPGSNAPTVPLDGAAPPSGGAGLSTPNAPPAKALPTPKPPQRKGNSGQGSGGAG